MNHNNIMTLAQVGQLCEQVHVSVYVWVFPFIREGVFDGGAFP